MPNSNNMEPTKLLDNVPEGREQKSPSPVLFVDNLAKETTISDLENLFGDFGDILSISLASERTRAEVKFSAENTCSAREAKEFYDGVYLNEKPMLLDFEEQEPVDLVRDAKQNPPRVTASANQSRYVRPKSGGYYENIDRQNRRYEEERLNKELDEYMAQRKTKS